MPTCLHCCRCCPCSLCWECECRCYDPAEKARVAAQQQQQIKEKEEHDKEMQQFVDKYCQNINTEFSDLPLGKRKSKYDKDKNA